MDSIKCRIIRAALAEFTLNGYCSVTLQHIADQAQCTKTAIMQRFGSKKKLYQWLIKNKFREFFNLGGGDRMIAYLRKNKYSYVHIVQHGVSSGITNIGFLASHLFSDAGSNIRHWMFVFRQLDLSSIPHPAKSLTIAIRFIDDKMIMEQPTRILIYLLSLNYSPEEAIAAICAAEPRLPLAFILDEAQRIGLAVPTIAAGISRAADSGTLCATR